MAVSTTQSNRHFQYIFIERITPYCFPSTLLFFTFEILCFYFLFIVELPYNGVVILLITATRDDTHKLIRRRQRRACARDEQRVINRRQQPSSRTKDARRYDTAGNPTPTDRGRRTPTSRTPRIFSAPGNTPFFFFSFFFPFLFLPVSLQPSSRTLSATVFSFSFLFFFEGLVYTTTCY